MVMLLLLSLLLVSPAMNAAEPVLPASVADRLNNLKIQRQSLITTLEWSHEDAYAKDLAKTTRRKLDKVDAQEEQLRQQLAELESCKVNLNQKMPAAEATQALSQFPSAEKEAFCRLQKWSIGHEIALPYLFSGGKEKSKKTIIFALARSLKVPCYFFSMPRFFDRYQESARSKIEELAALLSSHNERAMLVCKRLDVFNDRYEGTYKPEALNPTIHFWKNLKEIVKKNPKLLIIFTAQGYDCFSPLLKQKIGEHNVHF